MKITNIMDIEIENELIQNLKRLNINRAIADENAMVGGSPAVLLRWNGKEHYYTGFGSGFGDPPEIEQNLVKRFADQNLGDEPTRTYTQTCKCSICGKAVTIETLLPPAQDDCTGVICDACYQQEKRRESLEREGE